MVHTNDEQDHIIVTCDCHAHSIRVYEMDDNEKEAKPLKERLIVIDFFEINPHHGVLKGLIHKLKYVFRFLFQGKFCANEVIISGEDAVKLTEALNNIVVKNNGAGQ